MAGTGTAHLRPEADPVLSVEDLVVEFPAGGGQRVHAVSGISFDVLDGETLGILGESGCGKSSAGRAVLQLPPPTSGSVRLSGDDLTALSPRQLRDRRQRLQMIMQHPLDALNPRRRVRDLVAEGPSIWGRDADDARIAQALEAVGLVPEVVWDRRPHGLSGGQAQRVSIARALLLEPDVLVCDEPVASLDASVQAQILNMLEETREAYGLSMVFVAHDLAVVKSISDRVMVMYLGKVCEVIPADRLPEAAAHPYSRLLIASEPEEELEEPADDPLVVDDQAAELPSPIDPPSGCRFRTRCPLATDLCAQEEPRLREIVAGQYVACHHV